MMGWREYNCTEYERLNQSYFVFLAELGKLPPDLFKLFCLDKRNEIVLQFFVVHFHRFSRTLEIVLSEIKLCLKPLLALHSV